MTIRVPLHLLKTQYFIEERSIDVHFVRDKITAKELEVKCVNNENQVANILTKALPTTSFEYFRSKLNVYLHS